MLKKREFVTYAVVGLLAKIDGLADIVTMGCDNVIGMLVRPCRMP